MRTTINTKKVAIMNTIPKKSVYNKSAILKYAWKLFKAQDERTMEVFADCMRKSWNLAKNGMEVNDITALYNKHYKGVYNHIFFKVGCKAHIAEELTNDVFIKAQRHIESDNYDVYKAKINTWLYFIAGNIVIDHFRTAHADKFTSVDNFVDAESGKELFQIVDNSNIDNVVNTELSTSISNAIDSLKPKNREIAKLFFIEEKQYSEIAEILNMPLGSVKGTINRIRAMLQEQLQSVRS